MKYAIIRFGGKQFKVKEGDVFEIERQEKPVTAEVLLFSEDETLLIGEPVLTNVSVKLDVVEETRGDKIRVSRFRSKSRHRRVHGHKQPLSVIKVVEILGVNGESKSKVAKTEEKVVTEEVKEVKKAVKPVKKVTKSSKEVKAKKAEK
jgi:large subunit ribosomal protein L21